MQSLSFENVVDFGSGVYLVDAQYVRRGLAAIYLVVDDGEAAVIETGTRYSTSIVLTALDHLGLHPDAVRYVIPTHVHLDHAGGAGTMMAAFSAAQLIVHPSGAPHMIDPSRLWAAAVNVYGGEVANSLYGGLDAVPESRVVSAIDGLTMQLGKRRLSVIDTPGHAYHHICVLEPESNGVFTGDVFGLSYRELDVEALPTAVISTTPTQFDPAAMRASIFRILDLEPKAVYLTHFSKVSEVTTIGRQLIGQLDAYLDIELRNRHVSADKKAGLFESELRDYYEAWRTQAGWRHGKEDVQHLLDIDIRLNAQGLAYWSNKMIAQGK